MSTPSKWNPSEIMREADNTLRLYALIAVIVELGLAGAVAMTEGTDRTLLIAGMLLVLLTVVVMAGLKFVKPQGGAAFTDAGMPGAIGSLGGQPVSDEDARCWEGPWNCRWAYRTDSGELRPYVDDRIRIDSVDRRDGSVKGTGISVYEKDFQYQISGRVNAEDNFAQLIYSTPPPRVRLAGLFIVRLTTSGDLSGWWLGTDREGGDIGGAVTCTKPERDHGFHPRDHLAAADKSRQKQEHREDAEPARGES
jgi:hypothetical protein